jgi:hypothetical protein
MWWIVVISGWATHLISTYLSIGIIIRLVGLKTTPVSNTQQFFAMSHRIRQWWRYCALFGGLPDLSWQVSIVVTCNLMANLRGLSPRVLNHLLTLVICSVCVGGMIRIYQDYRTCIVVDPIINFQLLILYTIYRPFMDIYGSTRNMGYRL